MWSSYIGLYTKYIVCQCKLIKYLHLYYNIKFTPNCLPVNEHIEFFVRGSSKGSSINSIIPRMLAAVAIGYNKS